MTTTPAPFQPGDRVRRTKLDRAAGTVETVTPYESDTGQWAIAVKLDQDGEVWSGTEVAWEREPAAEPDTGGCSCAAYYLGSSYHTAPCRLAWGEQMALGFTDTHHDTDQASVYDLLSR